MSEGKAYKVRVSRRFTAEVTVWNTCCSECAGEEVQEMTLDDSEFQDTENDGEVVVEEVERLSADDAYSECDNECSECGYGHDCDHYDGDDDSEGDTDCYECGCTYYQDDMHWDDDTDAYWCESCWEAKQEREHESGGSGCPVCGASDKQEPSASNHNPGCEKNMYCRRCHVWYDPETGKYYNSREQEIKDGKKKAEKPAEEEVPEYIRAMLESQ